MQHSFIVNLLAQDRPGIVEALSDTVAQHGGNWLESRLARLGGQFAGIVRIQVEEKKEQTLSQALMALNSDSLTLTISRVESHPEDQEKHIVRFKVVGNDRPGIVQEISTTIARLGANLEELVTNLDSTPWSGEGLFQAEGLVSLPGGVDADALADKLEALADDLMVEIEAAQEA